MEHRQVHIDFPRSPHEVRQVIRGSWFPIIYLDLWNHQIIYMQFIDGERELDFRAGLVLMHIEFFI